MSPNLLEASADLGAHGTQTFRYVTFPLVRSALFAGGILAFALSFDEIVVTTFTAGSGYQTLPQWIFANISGPNNVPARERRGHVRDGRVDPARLARPEAQRHRPRLTQSSGAANRRSGGLRPGSLATC